MKWELPVATTIATCQLRTAAETPPSPSAEQASKCKPQGRIGYQSFPACNHDFTTSYLTTEVILYKENTSLAWWLCHEHLTLRKGRCNDTALWHCVVTLTCVICDMFIIVATITGAAGFPNWLIEVLGRWKSDAYQMYIKTPKGHYLSSPKELCILPFLICNYWNTQNCYVHCEHYNASFLGVYFGPT